VIIDVDDAGAAEAAGAWLATGAADGVGVGAGATLGEALAAAAGASFFSSQAAAKSKRPIAIAKRFIGLSSGSIR
jgi:hypothetical protein